MAFSSAHVREMKDEDIKMINQNGTVLCRERVSTSLDQLAASLPPSVERLDNDNLLQVVRGGAGSPSEPRREHFESGLPGCNLIFTDYYYLHRLSSRGTSSCFLRSGGVVGDGMAGV